MIFKNNHRPDCLVMPVVDLPEIDERCTLSTGIAEAPVVAVIGILTRDRRRSEARRHRCHPVGRDR
jgi:hypothetical protein